MAIIQTCCCCGWSLRRGCYVSAVFSLVYFFLFTWITGSLTVGRIQTYIFSRNMYDNQEGGILHGNFHGGPQQEPQNQHAIDRTSSAASLPSKSSSTSASSPSYSSAKKETEMENRTKRISTISAPVYLEEENSGNVSMLGLFLKSDAYSALQTVNLVLDLICEVAGVYASILLIRGLQQDKKTLFLPWMIVVPLHIAIDTFTICGIMMEYFVEPMAPLALVLLPILVDVTLNSINTYGLLCVISQYQEYKAGRGTAAYAQFTSQTPTIMLETTSSTKTVLTKPNSLPHNNRRRSTNDFSTTRTICNEKSESCCEEFSLHTLPNERNGSISKAKNGQVKMKGNEEESTSSPNSCVYNNLNEVTWIETPSILDKPESRALKKDSAKFGKYLDVKNGKGKVPNGTQGNGPTVKFACVNTNGKTNSTWLNADQSETTKSDSDSEDPTDDALSAFGIGRYAYN